MQLSEALEQINGMIDLVNALVLENQPESTEHAIRQLRDGMQAFAGRAHCQSLSDCGASTGCLEAGAIHRPHLRWQQAAGQRRLGGTPVPHQWLMIELHSC